jgi:hyaluronoglucosaminidase
MTHYVYAPKDDPKHRERWREPYDREELGGFARLIAESGLDIGFAISPGLSMDYGARADRAALAAKCEQVIALGVRLICLALDDIPFRAGLGEEHAVLTRWLCERLAGRASVVMVPTEYVGSRATPYLDALAGVPEEVLVGWTGESVVCDEISAAHARERARALGGRPPLLWDNFPVNDGPMADSLFIGPLRGREPGLIDELGGYLANVGLQPIANRLPLASIAAWLRRDDPEEAWRREADDLGWRAFAEACDGTVPRRLVAGVIDGTGDRAAVRAWFERAHAEPPPGLDDECEPWVTQVRREARVALLALDVLDAGRTTGGYDSLGRALELAVRWKKLTTSPIQVMGPRFEIRPGIGQADDGSWTVLRSSIVSGLSAVDALCRAAFDAATRSDVGLERGAEEVP